MARNADTPAKRASAASDSSASARTGARDGGKSSQAPKTAAKAAVKIVPKTTNTYHHGDLKNTLQAAAAQLIAERGVEGFSLREISQAAGVSHAAAYRHYADKQALLADLAEAGFRELVAINRRTVAATEGGPVEQLQACGRAYVRFGARQPQLLQLMFGSAISDWQSHPSLIDASSALAASLADVVKAGQESGELREGRLEDLTLTAWSLVHGLALLLAAKRIPNVQVDASFVRHASQRCVALLIDGLRR